VDDDIQAMRDEYLNKEFDEVEFEVTATRISEYARAAGELDNKFLDPEHEDFQAPPTFASTFAGRRFLPDGFPRPKGVGMDAGKGVEWFAPIRAGVKLTGKTHLHDIYTKTGRSGRMIFLVARMELFDDAGTHVANADTRTVIREQVDG